MAYASSPATPRRFLVDPIRNSQMARPARYSSILGGKPIPRFISRDSSGIRRGSRPKTDYVIVRDTDWPLEDGAISPFLTGHRAAPQGSGVGDRNL